MDRRDFIKLSSLAVFPLLEMGCETPPVITSHRKSPYDIHFHSDATIGHLLFEARNFPVGTTLKKDILVVGAGVAGLSAAAQFEGKEVVVCEASKFLGGSSGAMQHQGQLFSQGAHYDLAYPANYGSEVLTFFDRLGLIEYDAATNAWSFKDRQYLIAPEQENQCWSEGKYTAEVLSDTSAHEQMLELTKAFNGEMVQPTRLIHPKHHHLNNITFKAYLEQYFELDEATLRGLDHHMLDDYGGRADEVSALAGIHYYRCRPYYSKDVELFSPPEGNAYFVNKIAAQLSEDVVLTEHLVTHIEPVDQGFLVKVLDVQQKQVKQFEVNQIVYAAQKHTLKYLFKQDYHLFEGQNTAPWMVVNLILKGDQGKAAFWQNEIPNQLKHFLGFVDSEAQAGAGQRVLSAYFCLPPEARGDLLTLQERQQEVVSQVVELISKYWQQDISENVEKAYIKVMGHAMPVPVPGYLFKDKNEARSHPNLVFAGVDNGRLPLLFEAVDSGIQAANLLKQTSSNS